MDKLTVWSGPWGTKYGEQSNYVSSSEMDLICTDDMGEIEFHAECGILRIYKIEFFV